MKLSIRQNSVSLARAAVSSGALLLIGLVSSAGVAQAQGHIPVTLDLSPPFGSFLGETLHMEGNRFITGTDTVRVYEVDALGVPTLLNQFIGGPNFPGPVFLWGFTVAINGDLAVVADPGDDDAGIGGGAFAYERDSDTGTWSFAQKMEDDAFNGSLYGRSVVFHGDQVLVSETLIGPGRVHVFNRVDGAWVKSTVQPIIIPHNGWSNGNTGSQFGHAMAVSGDTLIVTQPFNSRHGANVYEWDGTQWAFDVELGFKGAGDNVGSLVGTEIDFDDDIVVLASPYEPHSTGVVGAGAAYIFERNGSEWTGPVRIEAPDPTSNAHFAYGVAVHAGTRRIAIGSPHWKTDEFTPQVGAGYVFHKEPAPLEGWQMAERLEPMNIAPGRTFGEVVQMNENVAIFGTRALGYSIHRLARNSSFGASSSPSRCHGDGGDQLGCVDCPCGNNAPPGTRGGCLNALGQSAQLSAERSLSVSNDSLRIKLEGAGAGSFAVLTSGSTIPVTAGCGPNAGRRAMSMADGLLCIGGGMRRHGGQRTGANGKLIKPWSNLTSNFGYVAGQVRIFQAIYRDGPVATCGTNLNSSNALEIVFTP